MGRCCLLAVALVCLPCAAWSQGNPLGPEFRVNAYTTSAQSFPAAASDAAGNFVVVWRSTDQDGSSYGIFGQRYASGGAALGHGFRVNTYTPGSQNRPAVASDGSGNFVVVWEDGYQDGSANGVVGQRYASTGAPLGPDFIVNTYVMDNQYDAAVASDAAGNFVVVWASHLEDGSGFGVFGQRYASSGAALGPEFRVNTSTASHQESPAVASSAAGDFVVVWFSATKTGSGGGIFGQRYASSGAPLGPEFQVNTYTTNVQRRPAVAMDPAGNFVVVWDSYSPDGSDAGVFGQRYASSGAPLGSEFQVNTYTTGFQGISAVASDASGNFVVVWTSDTQDGDVTGIFGQRFDALGSPLGPEFRANTYTTNFQAAPAVASDPSGSFVVVWASFTQDGSTDGIFGQRYSQIVPVELMRVGVE